MKKRKSRKIKIGNISIGGEQPITVQSMTKTSTKNIKATIKQIKALEEVGCDIVRLAVKDMIDAKALKQIKAKTNLPLVADIHFDFKLALASLDSGVDKLRINPGNMNNLAEIREIVVKCKQNQVPIRIGINAGSLEKDVLARYKRVTAQAMVASALKQIKVLEKLNFKDIVISLKASSVAMTIEANQLISKKVNYPLHLGVTEAGVPQVGVIKSCVGLGSLLAQGIGDTIRVSLTADPVEEVIVAQEILKSLDLLKSGVEVISCPVCGRCKINVEEVAQQVYEQTRDIKIPLKVAVMGCEVNGPGEAKVADLALIGGDKQAVIMVKNKIVAKVSQNQMVTELINQLKKLIK